MHRAVVEAAQLADHIAQHTSCLKSALISRPTPRRQPGGARAAPAGAAVSEHSVEGGAGAARAR